MELLAELPAEIRLLAEFLSGDERPALVVEDEHCGTGSLVSEDVKVVYSNNAYREHLQAHQQRASESKPLKDVANLSPVVGLKRRDSGGGLHLGQGEWSVRPIGRRWTVVIAGGEGQGKEERRADAVDSKEEAKEDVPHEQDEIARKVEADAANDRAEQPSLDWTRHDVKDISPWTRTIKDFDWADTELGPTSQWSVQLRGAVIGMMLNPDPRLVLWGANCIMIYNEACIPIFGDRHPGCLGRPVSETWADAWVSVEALIENSRIHGKPTKVARMPLTLTRKGYVEESYWDFVMTPLLDDEGKGMGVMDEFTESTNVVTGDRRKSSVLKIGETCAEAHTLKELWPQFLKGLEPAIEDIPFALFYSMAEDISDGSSMSTDSASFGTMDRKCTLEATVGISIEDTTLPRQFELTSSLKGQESFLGACYRARRERKSIKLGGDDGPLPAELSIAVPGRAFGDTIQAAMVVPVISLSGGEIMGLLVLTFSPRLPFDAEYTVYVQYMAEILLKSAALIALPSEHQRAQQISEDINSALSSQLRSMALQNEKSEANFWRMAQSSPTGMFQFKPDGKVVHVNNAYLEILGVPQEEVDTWHKNPVAWSSLILPEDAHIPLKAWDDIIATQAPVSCEYRTKKKWKSFDNASGSETSDSCWVLATAFPEIEADGTVSLIQGWLTDVSHQKFAEQLMAQRLEDALETKRQTLNFIDLTSHEMRNPLSAILQCADSIVNTLWASGMPLINEPMTLTHTHAEELIDSAQTIILCAQHQKRIADDILTLSKLDASLLIISPDKVQPPALARKAIRMYESELARTGISVDFELDASYAELAVDWVLLDPSRLLQVIINLLTNAMKFTQYAEHRAITIHMGVSHIKPTGKRHGVNFIPPKHPHQHKNSHPGGPEWGKGEVLYLQVAVTDTGAGLSEEEIQMLFQRFSQASPKTYKQYGGSGLGLFISRELCELQGGQIGVASQGGRTTFTFYVWARRWVEQTLDADDGGKEAAIKLDRGTSPSFSSGPTAFSRKGSLPMDAVATHNEAQTNGGALRKKVSRGLQVPANAESPKKPTNTKPTTTTKPTDQHVLIVEDNIINQQLLAKQLEKAGWTTHVANHGVECLDHLATTHFHSPPKSSNTSTTTSTDKPPPSTPLNIILLDLEMPTMDGLTCIRQIRAQQAAGQLSAHVPVIAVTANARSEQIAVAIEAGMDLVVTKPFRIPELVPQMRRLIGEVAEREEAWRLRAGWEVG